MFIDVVLQTGQGEQIEQALDWHQTVSLLIPSREDATFCCLRFIDPHSDTVFNSLQMSVFLEEWDRVQTNAQTQEQKDMWHQVRALAVQCEEGNHLYLRFRGD
ncbi:MAG TPA: hypothetical protein VF719_03480 [Abditibacteriaceae bacterium]|jgi:hypothetical protein